MNAIKKTDYHISLGNIALISTFFFFTQLLVDLFCAKFVDHIGYRVCIVASEIFAALGLLGLAFLPDFLPDPFIGIICSVIIYAIGSGLIDLLAMAGDLGGSIGPGIVGRITQNAGNNIRIGMGFGLIFPVILLFMLFLLYRKKSTAPNIKALMNH